MILVAEKHGVTVSTELIGAELVENDLFLRQMANDYRRGQKLLEELMKNGWVKSSFSAGNGACVEAAYYSTCDTGPCVQVHEHNGEIHVRDSKDPNGPFLTFSQAEWDAFVAGVKAGEMAFK